MDRFKTLFLVGLKALVIFVGICILIFFVSIRFGEKLGGWLPFGSQINAASIWLRNWTFENVFPDLSTMQTVNRKIAEEGDLVAQDLLGHAYLEGYGVPVDVDEAIKWFRMAAAQGYSKSQRSLGKIYQDAKFQKGDITRAYMWYYIAGNNGDAESMDLMKEISADMTSEEIAKVESLANDCIRTAYKECY